MATAHLILGLLANQPRHGYDVKTMHDQQFPRAKPLALGQVYATLHRLERDGLIRTAGRDRRYGPERTTYAVTEAGRSHIEAWLNTTEQSTASHTSTLPAKLACLRLVAPAQYQPFLRAQHAAHTTRLEELTALTLRTDLPLTDASAVDYAVTHIKADLAWLERLLDLE
jgi:DNA-binding PadR family transcriptional regulator